MGCMGDEISTKGWAKYLGDMSTSQPFGFSLSPSEFFFHLPSPFPLPPPFPPSSPFSRLLRVFTSSLIITAPDGEDAEGNTYYTEWEKLQIMYHVAPWLS